MARGGQRKAAPGAYLPNRSDMRTTQPIHTAPGQPYGEAGQQQQQQQAIPLANGTGAPAPAPVAPVAQSVPSPVAGQMGQSLFDPTNRPNEPVTAGAVSGPGPGPEVLGGNPAETPAVNALRAAYLKYPVDGLREIIENLDSQS